MFYVLIILCLYTREHAVSSRGALEGPSELLSRQAKKDYFFQNIRLWELQLRDRTHVISLTNLVVHFVWWSEK